MSDLYGKLRDYRDKLRDRENKHTPSAVISDEALKALAASKPTELDDMLKVRGIGSAFVRKYGLGFLNIILDAQKPVKLTMMRKEVKDTLKNLQARLTNVNRRNIMLYMPKLRKGKTVDLVSSDKDCGSIVDALVSRDARKTVLARADDSRYIPYKRLMRAANAAARETGANMLYAAYPFVFGKCGTESAFDVAAPLVLFPIALADDGGKIVMTSDPSRDVMYNNALVLCYNKFNGRAAEPLPDCTADDISKRDFIKNTLEFYAGCGMTVTDAGGAIMPYCDIASGKFPKYGSNVYELKRHAVVGLFPMYSGAMQKDFDDLIDSGVMPRALTDLLEGADEIDDFYGNSVDTVDSDVPLDSEGRVDYISELNVSQENAVERTRTETALVMQGPPGTGKSQTITSMISDAVNNGKSVLVVSQKRAALSVIYSRLGRLARYAVFVDDPKDKDSFYGRLKAMFEAESAPAPFNSVAFSKAVSTVDADMSALNDVEKKLESDEYGAPMLRIYRENMDNPFKAAERNTPGANDEAALFRDCVSDALLDCGYDDLKAAAAYLDDEATLAKLGEYYSLGERYSWLVDMKKNLSDADIAILLTELDDILDLFAQGRRRFYLRRLIKTFVKTNFVEYKRAQYKMFVKDPVTLYNGVKAYGDFYDAKMTADTLDYCTRLYFGTVYCLSKETGKTFSALNAELMDYIGYAFIDRFENENHDVMNRISDFSSVVARIYRTIDKKIALTRDKTLNILKTTFNGNIAESKRRGDMLRAIDGKRRPAVSAFVRKFDFELFRGVRIFLMTPEAVSELLPLENDLFDLLVFDEASQIYVERGIPAIARAKRIVVCGDHKQLRPSSLGDGRVTVDEDEDNDAALEEESLLDIARFKFPEVMLSYHYRSRYEELIAFSNAAFYGGKLNISPNPVPSRVPPIRVHKVNGVWEDRVNTAEAEKVVELLAQYLKESADTPQSARDTMGVITFNALQRDCILDLIDKRCASDKNFAARYAEEFSRREDGEDFGLFVKNIENVQGDERDRIIFSFAYAYNKNGVISRNFGWLNRQGGENRLNVAVSRAKRAIDIVTSIVPSDLKTDDIKSDGVKLLRKYLEYAYCVSDGDTDAAKRVLDSFSSSDAAVNFAAVEADDETSLASRVYNALVSRGIEAERNVGMGSYKLDIAVKNSRGEYVLGIECDETAFGSGASARERDVMRGKFFKSRGWNFMRVWSSDWYESPDDVIKNMLASAGG